MRKLFYDILLAAEKEQGFVPPAITRQILAMKRKRQKNEAYSLRSDTQKGIFLI